MQDRIARYGASSDHIARRQVSVLHIAIRHARSGESVGVGVRVRQSPNADRRAARPAREHLLKKSPARCSNELYRDRELPPPDDIVHVSCSGYLSPSPVQTFLSRRNWLNVGVTHSYHMGCYGAFPAVAPHSAWLVRRSPRCPSASAASMVRARFLSLHFDLLGDEPDNFVTLTLFADGSSDTAPIRSRGFAKNPRGVSKYSRSTSTFFPTRFRK